MQKKIIEHAVKNIFCKELGFEEGEFYYQYIKDINYLSKCEEHSKSKKYRILNKLFESGVVAKIGDNDKNPKYFPLPPTFLVERIENEKIVSDLEKIYLKNYFEEFKKNIDDKFLTISFRGYANNWLILFLLKYFMKETSIILMGGIKEYGFYKKRLTDSQFKKIRYFYRSDYNESKFNKELSKATQINYSKISNRRIAIIDDKILIEFLKFPNADHYTRPQDSYYAGYILGNKFKSNDGKNSVSYIYQMIKEVEEIIKI